MSSTFDNRDQHLVDPWLAIGILYIGLIRYTLIHTIVDVIG